MTTPVLPLKERLSNLFAMTDEAAKITRDEAVHELDRLTSELAAVTRELEEANRVLDMYRVSRAANEAARGNVKGKES